MSDARGRSGGKCYSLSGARRLGKWSGSSDREARRNNGDDGEKKDKKAEGKADGGKTDISKGRQREVQTLC